MDQRIGYNDLSADGELVYMSTPGLVVSNVFFYHIWDDDPHDYV